MNTLTSTDWAAEYKSLDLDVLKRINKWMIVAIPAVGALPVAAAFLVFMHQPGVGLILMITVLIFTLRQARKLYLLNRKPVVYSGIITDKSQTATQMTQPKQVTSHFTSEFLLRRLLKLTGAVKGIL